MSNWWSEVRTFVREYRTNFKHTGAVLPSGSSLGNALTRFVRKRDGATAPLAILEVGPGTGAVTRHIAASLQAGDVLHLSELNTSFVELLRKRFDHQPPFCNVAEQVRVFHGPVEELPHDMQYDLIISGLPLNNFNVDEVEHIFGIFQKLLKPGGTLSFFEYIGIRKVRAMVSDAPGKERLRGIARCMEGVLQRGEIHRDHVWPNVPPAYVHHVRFAKETA